MIGAAKGYRVKLSMPECVSTERQHILQALGAEVVLTPAKEGTDGAIRKAHQLLDAEPDKYYMPNQFENESNVLSHYETTGPEVFDQTNGEIDIFVAGMGTTGTLMGIESLTRYPFAAPIIAKAMPVFPDVGSPLFLSSNKQGGL